MKSKSKSRTLRMTTIIAGSLLAAVSCTSNAGDIPAATTTVDDKPSTTDEQGFDDRKLEQQWSEVWTIAGKPEAERAESLESIEPFLSDVAYELIEGSFIVGGDGERLPFTYPKFEENDDATVTISDCIVWDLPDLEGLSKWMEATAELNDEDDWVFTEITKKADGCVPEEVGEKVIADYEASIEAQKQYWNPANPDHPGIDDTVTGSWNETLKERLADLESKGWYLETDPDIHPEIFDYLSPGLIKVLDCQTDDSAGVFDAEGERKEGVGERRSGQRSIVETLMELDGDTWKVVDIQAQEDWECEFAPTDQGYPWV